jgi:hypothetical protein
MHVGNLITDWNDALLQRIDPAPPNGVKWPRALVVLTNQVYDIGRYDSNDPQNPCRIKINDGVSVVNPVIFDYLKRAAQAGAMVVFRVYPSPGNYLDNAQNHYLLTRAISSYCEPWVKRNTIDVADEIVAIYRFNQANGFADTWYGFGPPMSRMSSGLSPDLFRTSITISPGRALMPTLPTFMIWLTMPSRPSVCSLRRWQHGVAEK